MDTINPEDDPAAKSATPRTRKEKPEKMPTVGDEKMMMKAEFDSQKKFTVNLRQNPPNFPQLGNWVGQINGYGFIIKRNEPVEVPESVYLHLITCNEVQPLRTQDKSLEPTVAVYPLERGTISEQVKAGLINTTANVY